MEERETIEELERAVLPLLDEGDLPRFGAFEALRNWLIDRVGDLIDRDFTQLLRILYLIDVDETRVRRLLAESEGENAAAIIADLILERQAQKIRSRKKYRPKDGRYFDDV